MRLVDLDPRWWAAPGRHGQGVLFLCPHCRESWLAVAFANPLDGGPAWNVGTPERRPVSNLWELLYGDLEAPAERGTVRPGALLAVGASCIPPGFLWTRSGETFEALSLTPIDASAAGCWHGWVTAGEIR